MRDKHAPKGLFAPLKFGEKRPRLGDSPRPGNERDEALRVIREKNKSRNAALARSGGSLRGGIHGRDDDVVDERKTAAPINSSDSESEGHRAPPSAQRKAKRQKLSRAEAAALRRCVDDGAKESRMGQAQLLREQQQRGEGSQVRHN